MSSLMNEELKRAIGERGIIAVLEIADVKNAVPVAEALVNGGVRAIELTLRTPAALDAMREISKAFPEILIGAGTVLRVSQLEEARAAGAAFGVAPGFNPRVVSAAKEMGFPFAPGIATASELEGAVELGCDVLKVFPAEHLGGLKYLKGMSSPYNYLGLSFIPLGGLTLESLPAWAEFGNVLAVGGSWIAKRALIESGQFDVIEKNARDAVEVWKAVRK